MFRQVRIRFALRHDSFKIVFACKPEQTLAISVKMIAVKKTFTALRHHGMKRELAVGQWQIPKVFAILESAVFLIIVGLGVFIPENVESVKERLGTPEQQIAEERSPISIEAHTLAVENAAATLDVASQRLT